MTEPAHGDWKSVLAAAALAALWIVVSFWWAAQAQHAHGLVETGAQTTCEVRKVVALAGILTLLDYYATFRCPALPALGDFEREIGFFQYWTATAGDETIFYFDPAQSVDGVTALEIPIMAIWEVGAWVTTVIVILFVVWIAYREFAPRNSRAG